MSMFGSRAGGSSTGVNQEKVEMAASQLDMITDMFHKLTTSCFNKCITRFPDGTLTAGESLCIDRCVAKYFEVNTKVGEQMQAAGPAGAMAGAPGAGSGGKTGLF